MSLTALIWIVAFTLLVFRGFTQRPVFAACAYLMTYYAAPPFWWWGSGALTSMTMRWNLVGALALTLAVLKWWPLVPSLQSFDKKTFGLLFLYLVNACFVHYTLADNPPESWKEFDLIWKSCGLALMIRLSIWTMRDLQILFMAMLLLSAYIGYEVVINDAGTIVRGRLEGINFPGANGSNGASTILSMSFPLIGYFVVINPLRYSRLIAFGSAPFILDTLLRCNSRGAYLGAAIGGIILILMAKGKSRRYAIMIAIGGVLAFLAQAQDENIWNRLFSINASEEERDASASERLLYWEAGQKMILDYPLGSGGRAAFSSDRGVRYIIHIRQDGFRASHNGFVSITAGWGIQGFILYMLAFGTAIHALWRQLKVHARSYGEGTLFVAAAVLAALAGQLTCAMFGDYLDGEWFLWLVATALALTAIMKRSIEEKSLADPTQGADTVF